MRTLQGQFDHPARDVTLYDSQIPDVERAVLGAVLDIDGALPRLLACGLEPHDFASEAHRHVYRAAIGLHERGSAVDAFLLQEELERTGKLSWTGGKPYLAELAAAAVTANLEHLARLLRRHARERDLREKINRLYKVATNGGLDLSRVRRDLEEALELTTPDAAQRFPGLTHAEVLKREIPKSRELVEGLIERATVVLLAGLPDAGKSRLAVCLACKVAAGIGQILGRDVLASGAVAYWWQDDSETNELARIKDYSERNGYPADLPIRWHLNEGVRLPEDIPAVRAEIERERQVLALFDSYYNVVTGELKDEAAANTMAQVKHEICDRTGCTVAFLDHSPWPSEANRGQRRSYGSVFKAAAARSTIFLERARDGSVWVEARGNNVRGMKRTLVVWDEESLELRPVEIQRVKLDELIESVVSWVTEHPGAPTKAVEEGVGGSRESVRKALEEAATLRRLSLVTGDLAQSLGRRSNGRYWWPFGHKDLPSPGDIGATTGDSRQGPSGKVLSPNSPAPRRGGESFGDNLTVAPNPGGIGRVGRHAELFDADPEAAL